MNYTRTALGLLSAQYRSVLKKCFLINLGLFALGAVSAAPAMASINNYKGVEYKGKGTDTAATTLYFKWVQDTNLGVYKLEQTADAAEADITAKNLDERSFGGTPEPIPGLDYSTGKMEGLVYANEPYANAFMPEQTAADIINAIDSTFINSYINGAENPSKEVVSSALYNNLVLDKVSGTFLGNRVDAGLSNNRSYQRLYGSVYGGAFYNSAGNVFNAINTWRPENQGSVKNVSGNFIANGVVMTNPFNKTPWTTIWLDGGDPEDIYDDIPYQAYYVKGAYGGAIANQYGYIGTINSAVFENNYVISSTNNGITGDVGGAAIYNSMYYMTNMYTYAPEITKLSVSTIGDVTADFSENKAYTVLGNVKGGTILNLTAIGKASIGNINGNFSKNIAEAANGNIYGAVIANMLDDTTGTASIGTISSTFSKNKATTSSVLEGMIFNNDTIAGIENAIFDKNTGKAAYVYGGVILNYGEITNGIKNSTFTDNTFTASGEGLGAAVYTDQDLTIAADGADKKTLFKGNKINDDDTAVYADNADLTIAATNSGTVTFYDAVDGENATVAITGDETGTVQLYNDIKNSDVTVENVHIETTDDNGESRNYQLKSLTSAESAKYKIDFDVNAKTADTFETADPNAGTTVGTASRGRVTLEALKLPEGQKYSDITDDTFKVQVLKTQGTTEAADLQLALTDALKTELATKFVMSEQIKTVDDVVTADTKWSDEFKRTVTTTTKEGWLVLATTATLNDSIGISTETTVDVVSTKRGDTLALVNQAELAERNFNADQATYKVSDGLDNIGVTHAGTMNINGVSKDKSVLDGNGAKLFDLSEAGTTVSLNNVKVTNAHTVAKIRTKNAVFNLKNVELSGNQNGIENNGTLNISGVNKITDDISGNGTTNINSDWKMESKISGNTVNVNKAKLTIGKSNLANDVNLRANSGGNVVIGNNLINLKTTTFGPDSQLTLNIDDLKTFGGIRADKFDISNKAKIDITFGQNVLHGETSAKIPLLAYTDGSDINDNNFENVFHNNIYGFDKEALKSGIYSISKKKTAREVSQENGGTQNNQDAAGSWVDGPSHGNPTAQSIADDLARLAQKDGVEFNKELTALAPADNAVMSFLSEINNRVFSAVDNYLRNDKDEHRLTASTPSEKVRGRPNLHGINVWTKLYTGQSKHQRTGKVYGFDTKSYGVIAGVDKQINKDLKIGIGGRYEDADMNTFRKDFDISTSTLYGYGEYKPSNWFVNGIVKWDVSDWDEKRYMQNRIIKANYSVTALSAQILSGYEYKKNAWFITPQAGIRWHHIYRHGYTDTAYQTVSGRTMDTLSGVAGIHIQKDINVGGEKFRPDLYLGVTYDFISDRDRAMVGLTNGERYKVVGKRLKRLSVEISPSITYNLNDKWSANLQYTGDFREHYQNHTAFAGLKYKF